MAFMCSSSDANPWISTLNPFTTPTPDGHIIIDREDVNTGNFNGRHTLSSPDTFKNIVGKCIEVSAQLHRIRLIVLTDVSAFLYWGDVTNGNSISGHRRKLVDLPSLTFNERPIVDDEDWVATKT